MSKRASISFVVRASIQDGLGHLVRTLCVVRQVKARVDAKLMVLGDGSGRHLVEAAEVSSVKCESDEEAARQVLEVPGTLVVFDTLRFGAEAFSLIKERSKTVSLSPVFSEMSRVDYLFHRTQCVDPMWKEFGAFPEIHKGLQFAILPSWLKRVSSRHYREQLREDRLAVAISMGGTDAPNRTLALMKLLGASPVRLVLYVALGDAYTHSYEELLACASASQQEVILLKSNESMWRVLRNVSLVVCAGGLTTYEAAFIGLPAINLLQHARWAYLFEELAGKGACRTLPPSETSLEEACVMICDLVNRREQLMEMHQAAQGLVPSGGARRIADELIRLARKRTAEV
jgi:spore coat polysaccharide biosynthesis predicted glycosyltransferase SpsG